MKQSKRNVWWSVCAGLLFCSWGCSSQVSDKPVTLETLLDEMVSVEEQALYPVPLIPVVRKVATTVHQYHPILPVGLPIVTGLESNE